MMHPLGKKAAMKHHHAVMCDFLQAMLDLGRWRQHRLDRRVDAGGRRLGRLQGLLQLGHELIARIHTALGVEPGGADAIGSAQHVVGHHHATAGCIQGTQVTQIVHAFAELPLVFVQGRRVEAREVHAAGATFHAKEDLFHILAIHLIMEFAIMFMNLLHHMGDLIKGQATFALGCHNTLDIAEELGGLGPIGIDLLHGSFARQIEGDILLIQVGSFQVRHLQDVAHHHIIQEISQLLH
mmetsp:Transcript_65147/g.79729  ORF Transcript_65147/g.79729 Transcript_65147/m.79729 type:complete len:239 (+) Transcript_65147:426-1142(+)